MATTEARNEQFYNCSCCDKEFLVKEQFETHQFKKHSLLPFKCPKKNCKRSFLQEEYLKKHICIDHISKIEKSYKCKETQKCIDKGVSFSSQGKLNQHLYLHGEKKFKCAKCEKAFTIKFYLDSHMRTHTGEKLFLCRKCNKPFSSFSSRKYHEKNLH
jgi:KRAB domain-containing zinc finger protein